MDFIRGIMDGILLINKEKGVTSRDVVNQISLKLKTKKVGHAGTLDPLATGLLIIGVGKGTKIIELLTASEKEYIATVKMGIETDTLDITGQIINENYDFKVNFETLKECLTKFQKSYYQEVPKYSAVKINGKKLYEYARENKEIELPKRLVTIKKIEILDFNEKQLEFTFKVLVSKGTYIRSLIKDIGEALNIYCTMKDLVRTKSGKFLLENSKKIEDELNLISIREALDVKSYKIEDETLLKKIKNGNKINFSLTTDLYILFLDKENNELALYKNEKNNLYKAFKVF